MSIEPTQLAIQGGPRAVPEEMTDHPTGRLYIIEWDPEAIGIPSKYKEAYAAAIVKMLRAEGVLIDYLGEGFSALSDPGPNLLPTYKEAIDKVVAWIKDHSSTEVSWLRSIA